MEFSKNNNHRAIRNFIDTVAKLPKKGIFAGQAVASAIYEILGLTENAPYKDIDMFSSRDQIPKREIFLHEYNNEIKGRRDIGLNKYSQSEGKEIKNVSFSVNVGDIDQTGYIIKSCFMSDSNPNVNFVEIEQMSTYPRKGLIDDKEKYEWIEGESKRMCMNILNSFDLNCVQISIDLANNEIHWTREFQDFLFSKEIKACYFGTPMHTAVRILKKESEIDFATLNIDLEMRKLQTARQIGIVFENLKKEHQGEGYDFIPGSLFSEAYEKRFMDRYSVLSKYFEIERKTIKVKKTNENGLVIEEYNFSVLIPNDYDNKTIEIFKKMEITPSIKKNEDEVIVPFIDQKISNFSKYYNICNMPGKKNIKILQTLNNLDEGKINNPGLSIVSSHLIKNNRKDLSGLQEEHLRRMIKFTNRHPQAISILMDNIDSLRDITEIVKKLNWIEKNNMRHFIGFLERGLVLENENEFKLERIGYNKKEKTVMDALIPIVQMKRNLYSHIQIGSSKRLDVIYLSELTRDDYKEYFREKNKEIMIKGMNIKVEPVMADILRQVEESFNCKLTEITSWSGLIIEGGEMEHCVGGYWSAIDNIDSFIIHVEKEMGDKITPSTIEIGIGQDKTFKIIQHRGKRNEEISPIEVSISERIVSYLNNDMKSIIEPDKYETERDTKELENINKAIENRIKRTEISEENFSSLERSSSIIYDYEIKAY